MCWAVRFAGGLAVIAWIGYTLYAVTRFGGAVVLDVDTTSRIMAVTNSDRLHSAIGLTYHGLSGAALVVAEIALVIAATIMAFLGTGRWRVAGIVALVGWTGVWLGNALWLQGRGWDHPRVVALLVAAMLVTIAWSWVRLATCRAAA